MKNFTKLKALMLSFMVLTAITMSAQRSDGFFNNYNDNYENRTEGINDNTGSGIQNDPFGVPLGSGLLVLTAVGAGYAMLRRKKHYGDASHASKTALLLAVALILGITGCKKKVVEPINNTAATNGVSITLNVGDGSKVNVSGADVTFTNGDKILVASNGHYVGTLTHNGSNFSGSITDPVVGEPLYFYFLGNRNTGSLTAGTSGSTSCTVNISDQTDYPHLPVISMGVSIDRSTGETVNYASGTTSYEAQLHNKCSLMKFNVTTSSTRTICITGMNNKVTVNFGKVDESGDGLTGDTDQGFSYSVDETDGGLIKLKGGSGSPAEKWAIVLPQAALDAGEAFSEDYYIGTRPALSAISTNQYLDSGVSMTVNSKWDGNLSSLSGSKSERYTTATDGMTITGAFQDEYRPYKISIAAGATVTLNGVDINSSGYSSPDYAGLTCLGDATIILKNGTTNTVKGFDTDYPGIHVPSGKTLTIQGTGTLNASSNSYSYAAGIGGGDGIPCGNITITSGTITATCGGYSSAGIGGGDNSSCGAITINGGTVTATGGDNGAGIGSGRNSSCGIITISSGTVTATGGDYATGIGSSGGSSCGNITISGGSVTATGGEDGAGIGSGGYSSSCGDITISGGTVEATGGRNAAGIGGGNNSSCSAITISNTVNSITATKGDGAYNSIGKSEEYSYSTTCGTVTIGGTVYYNGSSYQNEGEEYLSTSPLVYEPNPPTPPSGANAFTINNVGNQVVFSQGNLQYQASTGTWRFAANQYDYIGSDNSYISSSYSGWIDLFGWGTGNNPTMAYSDNSYYSTFNDWGSNVIGSDAANTWRTLTLYEWGYIIYERPDAVNKYAAATVNDVHGMVLLPDSWTLPDGCTFTAGQGSGWSTNTYNVSQWASMEAAGAVFLPAAGDRDGTTFSGKDSGTYWTSSPPPQPGYSGDESIVAMGLDFNEGDMRHFIVGERHMGCSVRLVHDAN